MKFDETKAFYENAHFHANRIETLLTRAENSHGNKIHWYSERELIEQIENSIKNLKNQIEYCKNKATTTNFLDN